ncbi:hypothetical protein RCO28_21860 [Streptomyces sp. LHD-70]|uniref:hypothetical protein n=1 Tax=Streptomyces sp. LHD-70 TaxID=3072140 RepID=UPI00280FA90D|nr:hypothetical protein [Streptomyces sp. LHD-70]MDQ8705119.1 hypothetical protein [Streptomyces sp. LHD-70]
MPNWNSPPPPPDRGTPRGGPRWGQPPPPKRSGTGRVRALLRVLLRVLLGIAAVVIAIGVIAVVTGDGGGDEPPRTPPRQEQQTPPVTGPRADVEITSCTVPHSTRRPTAELRITNHSSKPSDYVIGIEFVDAGDAGDAGDARGERVAEGFVTTHHLAPGQVARKSATGFEEADGPVKCRITDVSRHASN